MPARNGTWKAYRLVDGDEVVAWFIAHSDVDPEMEVDKILRVSGSPYEKDFGSKVNTVKTAAEGVFVINRYGWGRGRSLVDEEEFPRVVRESGVYGKTGKIMAFLGPGFGSWTTPRPKHSCSGTYSSSYHGRSGSSVVPICIFLTGNTILVALDLTTRIP